MRKKQVAGDHSIVGALIMVCVAVMVLISVMNFVFSSGTDNANALSQRTTTVMHSDGTVITEY